MEQQKYYVKGTVYGSRLTDNDHEDMESYELLEYFDDIKELFTRDSADELAQYMWEDEPLYGVVTEIWVDVKIIDGMVYSWTEVTAERELTETEKKCLLDYLTGQFSDGYGEGLEQREFTTYTDTEECEEWDEEEQEYYTDEYDVTVSCYFHLWRSKEFKLEFVNCDEYSESEAPADIKPRCKLIGEDGNIYNLIGIASRTLRRVGLSDKAKEMTSRIYSSGSYSEALSIIAEYVEVV